MTFICGSSGICRGRRTAHCSVYQYIGRVCICKAETAVNPDKVIPKFITSRKDAPTGSKENIFDGDESTSAVYKTPNSLSKDDYIGVEYNKVIDIDSIRFLLGGGKDHLNMQNCSI